MKDKNTMDGREVSAKSLAEHRRRCKAIPGNCPFEKAFLRKAENEDSVSGAMPGRTLSDRRYLEAVARDDKRACELMIREAAARAMQQTEMRTDGGVPRIVYRGSDESPNVFRERTFFTLSKAYARNYGKVRSFYLNVAHLKDIGDIQLPCEKETVDDFSRKSGVALKDIFALKGIGSGVKNDYYEEMGGVTSIFEIAYNKDFAKMLSDRGFDAFVAREGDESYQGVGASGRAISIAVLDPHLVKLADPVTYDDNGDPIPISKRFDFRNPDIRY